jgi:hypothetical protein
MEIYVGAEICQLIGVSRVFENGTHNFVKAERLQTMLIKAVDQEQLPTM